MKMNIPVTDRIFIEKLIPQKPPFVMVGGLLAYSNVHLISEFIISEDNIFVSGGIFQASGLIEHQAQSVALHTGYKYYLLGQESPTGYIGVIKSFEAQSLPKVGDKVVSEIKIINEMMDVTLVEITSRIGENTIAKSEMKTVVK